MAEIVVHSRTIEVRGLDGASPYLDRIQRTLSLLPARHVAQLVYVGIRNRENYAGGSTNWVSSRDHDRGLWIMLDIDSFDPTRREINNRPPDLFHYTLLHEMGHVIDHAYRGTRWVRRHARAGYNAMMAHPHAGEITTGPGEHFADTYADFFFYRESERPTDERMTALLASPVFDGLTVARRP